MTGLFDETENLADVSTPFVQNLVIGLLLLERHDTRRSIDTSIDRLICDELAQRPLGCDWRQVEELSEALHSHPGVVLGNNPNVLPVSSQPQNNLLAHMFDYPLVQIFPARDTWFRHFFRCLALSI